MERTYGVGGTGMMLYPKEPQSPMSAIIDAVSRTQSELEQRSLITDSITIAVVTIVAITVDLAVAVLAGVIWNSLCFAVSQTSSLHVSVDALALAPDAKGDGAQVRLAGGARARVSRVPKFWTH